MTWWESFNAQNKLYISCVWEYLAPCPKLRPSLSTLAAPCEPLIGGEGGKEKEGDNSFNPSVTARLLSLGLILKKRFSGFSPQQSAKRRGPWEIFYSGDAKFCAPLAHTGVHIQAAVFVKEDLFCPIFTSCGCRARLHIRLDGIVLEESNSEDESWRLL